MKRDKHIIQNKRDQRKHLEKDGEVVSFNLCVTAIDSLAVCQPEMEGKCLFFLRTRITMSMSVSLVLSSSLQEIPS